MSVWRTTDFFWPKEISNYLPEARVLAWTFTPSKKHFVWDTQSIHKLASCLLNDISRDFERKGPRPLVFVAYSLGGLVLKRVSLKTSSVVQLLTAKRQSFRLLIDVKAMAWSKNLSKR
jgi:hypothetical protein